MPESDVTLGEVHRRLVAMAADNNARFAQIERRVDIGFEGMSRTIAAQQYVHIDRYDADRRADHQRFELLDQRHDDQRDTTRRLYWLVLATVIGLIGEAVLFLALTRGGP